LNLFTAHFLKLLGSQSAGKTSPTTRAQPQGTCRTLVNEAGALISQAQQNMLVSILEPGKSDRERTLWCRRQQNPSGIDMNDLDSSPAAFYATASTPALPVYKGDINDIQGNLAICRNPPNCCKKMNLNKDMIAQLGYRALLVSQKHTMEHPV